MTRVVNNLELGPRLDLPPGNARPFLINSVFGSLRLHRFDGGPSPGLADPVQLCVPKATGSFPLAEVGFQIKLRVAVVREIGTGVLTPLVWPDDPLVPSSVGVWPPQFPRAGRMTVAVFAGQCENYIGHGFNLAPAGFQPV